MVNVLPVKAIYVKLKLRTGFRLVSVLATLSIRERRNDRRRAQSLR